MMCPVVPGRREAVIFQTQNIGGGVHHHVSPDDMMRASSAVRTVYAAVDMRSSSPTSSAFSRSDDDDEYLHLQIHRCQSSLPSHLCYMNRNLSTANMLPSELKVSNPQNKHSRDRETPFPYADPRMAALALISARPFCD